jgi:hypothetical protein
MESLIRLPEVSRRTSIPLSTLRKWSCGSTPPPPDFPKILKVLDLRVVRVSDLDAWLEVYGTGWGKMSPVNSKGPGGVRLNWNVGNRSLAIEEIEALSQFLDRIDEQYIKPLVRDEIELDLVWDSFKEMRISLKEAGY